MPWCYWLRGNSGGGRDQGAHQRRYDPADVRVPPGYTVALVTSGLECPPGITLDAASAPCIVESGFSPLEHMNLLRIENDGRTTVIATGRAKDGPWNGVVCHGGAFWITGAGATAGGRIVRVAPDGSMPAFGEQFIDGGQLDDLVEYLGALR